MSEIEANIEAPDPIALIRGPARPDAWFRCKECGLRQQRAQAFPTGGVRCAGCQSPLGQGDLIDVGSLQIRAAAVATDIVSLALLYILLAFIVFFASPWVPTDEEGRVTPEAQRYMTILTAIYFATYLTVCEIVGRSPGKMVLGLQTVRMSDWHRPGLIRGCLRLVAKAATVATLGIPALIALRDPLSRTPHDRLTATIVIHK